MGSCHGCAAEVRVPYWLVEERQITPYIPVIDRSSRQDGTFTRADFTYDAEADAYTCPEGNTLTTSGTVVNEGTTRIYLGSTFDCGPCRLKERCCPKTPARKIPRSIYEHAREVARALAGTPAFERSRQGRKRIEMLFAHLKRILRMGRLRLRGPCGAQDEFLLAATAQNLRKLAKLAVAAAPQVMPAARGELRRSAQSRLQRIKLSHRTPTFSTQSATS